MQFFLYNIKEVQPPFCDVMHIGYALCTVLGSRSAADCHELACVNDEGAGASTR